MHRTAKKVLVVVGTRPEAIKLAPLYHALDAAPDIDAKLCVTAQHREMLDQVLGFFEMTPDVDLDIMRHNQNLYDISIAVLAGMRDVLSDMAPDMVIVQGDTSTSFLASLAAFYAKIPVSHVEAGLRTRDVYSPFPEEMNRQLTSRLASYHFAPTEAARENLLSEGIAEDAIVVTGNTGIDALLEAERRLSVDKDIRTDFIETHGFDVSDADRFVLVTVHRRENHGERLTRICRGIKALAHAAPEVFFLIPMHPNPNVREVIRQQLDSIENVKLLEPLGYRFFVWLMTRSLFILTDSGGVQEEAPSLGVPVVVMRESTERPEAVEAGTSVLVGADEGRLLDEAMSLLEKDAAGKAVRTPRHVYGDGDACRRIVEMISGTRPDSFVANSKLRKE